MFIRESQTTNRKTGASYTSYKLVEAYRSDRGPRQRVILSLPELHLPKSEWRKLAIALEARIGGQLSLFEDDPQIAAAAEQAMRHFDFHQLRQEDLKERAVGQQWTSVDLQSVETTDFRSLGPELVGHTLWERFDMPNILEACGFTRGERALAEAVVVGRLVAPSSDLATWSWLRNRTALTELVEEDLSDVGKDAVYEMADELLAHKSSMESALRAHENLLFPQVARVFLYDLTNVYLEGAAEGNTLAKYGRSKEKRSDCRLVTLALLVDEYGFPVLSHAYGGNQSEPETLGDTLTYISSLVSDLGQVPTFRDKVYLIFRKEFQIPPSDNRRVGDIQQFFLSLLVKQIEEPRDVFLVPCMVVLVALVHVGTQGHPLEAAQSKDDLLEVGSMRL